jgi:hypothetical protein
MMEDLEKNRSQLPATNQGSARRGEFPSQATEDILGPLPNDFTRIIYLASIRDYNSGTYRHPILSRQIEAGVAHEAFRLCHQEVFARMLVNPISQYVQQLEEYIRYSRAERGLFITTWNSLQAYKAAIPLQAPKRACETFYLNVTTALRILEFPS